MRIYYVNRFIIFLLVLFFLISLGIVFLTLEIYSCDFSGQPEGTGVKYASRAQADRTTEAIQFNPGGD